MSLLGSTTVLFQNPGQKAERGHGPGRGQGAEGLPFFQARVCLSISYGAAALNP